MTLVWKLSLVDCFYKFFRNFVPISYLCGFGYHGYIEHDLFLYICNLVSFLLFLIYDKYLLVFNLGK